MLQISEKKYVYIFVRQDISIPQQLVQASHAAHESGLAHSASTSLNSIVIFGAKDKPELESLLDRFRAEIDCHAFFEPYKDTGLTAFATPPLPESKRDIFKGFKLWQPKQNKNII